LWTELGNKASNITMDNQRGALYLASGERYKEEATLSAKSLREYHPDLPVTIFTDQEEVDTSVFDNVVQLSNPINNPGDSILSSKHLPYERTLYLDADTFVCGDISEIFELLDAFDVAAGHEVGRSWWNRNRYIQNDIDLPESFPEYNTGVIAYRDNDPVKELFDSWNRVYKKVGGELNQPAFRVASYRSDAEFATLPPEYNFMTHTVGFASGPVKILHQGPSNVDLESVAEKINGSVGTRIISWDKNPCRVVSDESLGERR